MQIGMKAMVLLALLLLSTNYLFRYLRFSLDVRRNGECKIPATVPYFFPILRSTFNFVWNPLHFVRSVTYVRTLDMNIWENNSLIDQQDFIMENKYLFESKS